MSVADKLTTVAENVPKVYEAGKQTEYGRFWDAYQLNGKRTDYDHAFAGAGWNTETFHPKYDIKPKSGYMMFRYFPATIDMVEWLKELGVTFDNSNNTSVAYMFFACNFTRIDTVNLCKISGTTGDMFAYSSNLHTIDKIICQEKTAWTSNTFTSCSNLANLTIEGVIGGNVSFKACPLTAESAKSIISALKDYSGTDKEYTYSVTFSASTLELLEAEGATAPGGLTWTEYIKAKRWNY